MRGSYKHLIELLNRQNKRKEIGVLIDAFLLMSVGELNIRKNHKVVKEALQKLPNNYWHAIVDKSELKEELEK